MGLNLLIAEPNDELRDALVRYFSHHGFAVRTAVTGAGLSLELQRELPQAVLLEPEVLCGFVTCGAPSVPTVVLTRHRRLPLEVPPSFVVEQHFEKPARLAQVAASLRAAAHVVT